MKYLSLFLVFALFCVFFVQTEGAHTRVRRDDVIEHVNKDLADAFDSFKKAAEEVASKIDFAKLQEDITNKLNEFAKSFSDMTGGETKAEAGATGTP